MKRAFDSDGDPEVGDDRKMKKVRAEEEVEGETEKERCASVLMDENMLYEVLKHVDARTLATAACVSKQWNRTAQDERIWELICTRHWANIGYAKPQLRSVVLALGGFRRLHTLYLVPLTKSSSSSPARAAWPPLPPAPMVAAKPGSGAVRTRWGKDEVHLSLSLLSIRYYEMMNFNGRGKSL
ncbi:hypothetical protein NMG60_11016486 [Bertholletia excelsa]